MVISDHSDYSQNIDFVKILKCNFKLNIIEINKYSQERERERIYFGIKKNLIKLIIMNIDSFKHDEMHF